MQVQFIGSGDAFGSGGRFNTCFHVTGKKMNFLIDCGASSLIALKANNIDLNSIDTILFSHFHADHFGGIPFFMLVPVSLRRCLGKIFSLKKDKAKLFRLRLIMYYILP